VASFVRSATVYGAVRRWARALVIASNRVDLTPLVTHLVKLDDIEKARRRVEGCHHSLTWVNSEECEYMAKIERRLSTLSSITRALVNLTNRCVVVEWN
jgi:hypothetical protein